jgi:hypothetical protein
LLYTRVRDDYTHVSDGYTRVSDDYTRVSDDYTHVIVPNTYVIVPDTHVSDAYMRVRNECPPVIVTYRRYRMPRMTHTRHFNLAERQLTHQTKEIYAHGQQSDATHPPRNLTGRP